MRREIKILKKNGFWIIYDRNEHKNIDRFTTELEAYKYALCSDFKLVF